MRARDILESYTAGHWRSCVIGPAADHGGGAAQRSVIAAWASSHAAATAGAA
jgi:hypothetical protein